ncbi:hypothetical protein M431DRAFT_273692 [Trichoderma harzianum CBS 226.95]|uniref:Uncharacterized protein n=1 Tax=Trichoderma harzianum CBS 226.95 TaxID=983964 RepID=A0A2T3ZX74_TRIHA|nr:hypothetical protein M431DRAFT_273692 [Trichoderma harzianum CBS 226.95]PTB49416.1 hypothetical protein M431DRAFT_273692 [Trichoderma harzianum CBS 226.95]
MHHVSKAHHLPPCACRRMHRSAQHPVSYSSHGDGLSPSKPAQHRTPRHSHRFISSSFELLRFRHFSHVSRSTTALPSGFRPV